MVCATATMDGVRCGLFIHPEHGERILNGTKVLELRRTRVRFPKRVALVYTGEKRAHGVVDIVGCEAITSNEQLFGGAHGLDHGALQEGGWLLPSPRPLYGWVLRDPHRLPASVPVRLLKGQQTWIRFDHDTPQRTRKRVRSAS